LLRVCSRTSGPVSLPVTLSASNATATDLAGKPLSGTASVTVNGGRGFWIEGAPHQIFYRDVNGQVHDRQLRLAGNTLIWEQDGLTLRLESALSKDEALRIAASVVPRP